MATRKQKAFNVPPEIVLDLFRGNDKIYTDGVPIDSRLVDIKYDHLSGCVTFIVDTEFGRSAECGEQIPIEALAYKYREQA